MLEIKNCITENSKVIKIDNNIVNIKDGSKFQNENLKRLEEMKNKRNYFYGACGTFNMWYQFGRYVAKGEKGCKISIPVEFDANKNPIKYIHKYFFFFEQTRELERIEKKEIVIDV